MIYKNFQDKQLSMLGFGAMRLPLIEGTNQVDEEQVFEMVRYMADHGVNYYDTAHPYHGGESEKIIGRALKQLPRDSYYLATKYPGHQLASSYDPAEIFEEQLEKCDVEYFDFYLLHNVCEMSMPAYTSEKWQIIPYFLEQKRNGRIKHLGFSTHARVECLDEFLSVYGKDMEFCQIQMNYLDWTLQNAKEKCEVLAKYDIPVWIMEPVRGGKLANLSEENHGKLEALRPGATDADWGYRWFQDIPGVAVVLSGMSNVQQMVENIATFETYAPLNETEKNALYEIAEGMKSFVPCTACRYCCDGCPQGIDIPNLLNMYNDYCFAPSGTIGMTVDLLPEGTKPSDCIGCGACMNICPQSIDIPAALADFTKRLASTKSWAEICREREEAAIKARAEKAARQAK